MKQKYTALYKKVGKWYAASVVEIPGVHTQGKTLQEAKENLADALKLVIETNRWLAFKESKKAIREYISVSVK